MGLEMEKKLNFQIKSAVATVNEKHIKIKTFTVKEIEHNLLKFWRGTTIFPAI